MKPVIALIFFFFTASMVSHAQQRTRDILFPDFQKDITKQHPSEKKDDRSTASSTRTLIFKDYHPQQQGKNNTLRATARNSTAGKKLPSDMSAADAAKAKPVKPAPKTALPSQGTEPANNTPKTPAKTPTPATTRKQS